MNTLRLKKAVTHSTLAFEVMTILHCADKERLVQMRLHKSDTHCESAEPDNFLRGEIECVCSLKRIKRANLIGLYYWNHGKESVCNEFTHQEFPRLQGAEKTLVEKIRMDPAFTGDKDFARVGMGLELDCFASFLSRSFKEQLVEEYYLSSHHPSGSQQPEQRMIEGPEQKVLALTNRWSYSEEFCSQSIRLPSHSIIAALPDFAAMKAREEARLIAAAAATKSDSVDGFDIASADQPIAAGDEYQMQDEFSFNQYDDQMVEMPTVVEQMMVIGHLQPAKPKRGRKPGSKNKKSLQAAGEETVMVLAETAKNARKVRKAKAPKSPVDSPVAVAV